MGKKARRQSAVATTTAKPIRALPPRHDEAARWDGTPDPRPQAGTLAPPTTVAGSDPETNSGQAGATEENG